MGSIITLGIKKMDIDWGKNNYFNNHSILFQKNDFDVELPYYYYNDDDTEKKFSLLSTFYVLLYYELKFIKNNKEIKTTYKPCYIKEKNNFFSFSIVAYLLLLIFFYVKLGIYKMECAYEKICF